MSVAPTRMLCLLPRCREIRYPRVPRSRSAGNPLLGHGGQRRSQTPRRPQTQAADGTRRARPQRCALGGAHDSVGRLPRIAARRLSRYGGCCFLALSRGGRYTLGQRRAGMPLVQHQQVQRRSHPPGCGASGLTSQPSCCATTRSPPRSRSSSEMAPATAVCHLPEAGRTSRCRSVRPEPRCRRRSGAVFCVQLGSGGWRMRWRHRSRETDVDA